MIPRPPDVARAIVAEALTWLLDEVEMTSLIPCLSELIRALDEPGRLRLAETLRANASALVALGESASSR